MGVGSRPSPRHTLRRGWKERDRVETQGRLLQLLVAGPGSLLNRYPIGNTGRARAAATLPMPITVEELRTAVSTATQPIGDDQRGYPLRAGDRGTR